ncbi:MAG: undecaprenyldiphospho-muramoylpentapeptide beta-N-acetylglucosaminyltransferase [Acutalibacteraceae bacterium]
MHIVFACGGTGGHINPALAVAGYIREHHPDAEISFIGNETGMESRLVPDAGFDFYPIKVAGFQRKINFTNIKRNLDAFVKMFTSSAKSKKILKGLKPDVVVGMGGYVSGPVLREAHKLGIKTATHEQNAYPGVTTKALVKFVDTVMLAMEDAKLRLPSTREYVVTGNPVRGSITGAKKDASRKFFNMDNRLMILSFGGSLGAKRINETVAAVIAWHADSGKYYHYHAMGKFGSEWMPDLVKSKGVNLSECPWIRMTEYINDMDLCMSAADLVICRAGAITLSELEMLGKPSILIPSPNVAENHQYHNAMSLAKRNAAVVLEEKYLTEEKLIKTVNDLISDKAKLEEMGRNARSLAITDAVERIYLEIMKLI